MSKEILLVVDAVSNEKGVAKSVIFEALESALGDRASFASDEAGAPRAAWVGELGARLLAQGLALPPERVQLVYLRAGVVLT